ncbi:MULTISPECIES: nuclear transport factor 2 family protein [Rhodococcus]|uniref:Nuclear transport factor 2 family protein n=1 Tax=Rhodococcus opacus TaxID=37919 RepID=A0AAX3YSY8_RHOOP|nr:MULTISPECIES: nuclear transport factor 2 family protein [Rhodococcus]NHU45148.1 nuclear transport factor 2 family protein [Rhodococcus sp. A14]MCZ4588762.1 nuclear transport factor 2 family protein [Rhodococcus opacus]QSE85955.1 nuclear transport factor 2 family protein [Rhodococcus koreensis]UZG59793.1 nuclear transport factor 2 family protein [Rhodococcus opacus]WLF51802.1 nuclear transport factor 2 family protein [Rhodococcus opacus]
MASRAAQIVRGTLGLADEGINGDLTDASVEGQADPFHENIVVREAAELPYGGEWKGKEGLRALMTKIQSLANLTVSDIDIFDVDEQNVITRQTATFKRDGADGTLTIPMVEVYRFENDQIVEIDVYYKDTKAMVDYLTP